MGHVSLDVTLAYRKGKDAESESLRLAKIHRRPDTTHPREPHPAVVRSTFLQRERRRSV